MATIRRAGFGSVFEVENETVGIGTTGTATNTLQVLGDIKSSDATVIGLSTLTTYQGFVDKKARFGKALIDIESQAGTLGDVVIEGDVTVSSASTFCSSLNQLTLTDSFSLPTGNTDSRIHCHTAGSMRFNEDFGTLEFYTGDEWRIVNSIRDTGNRGRGVFVGGYGSSHETSIDFVNIQSRGNSQSFGSLSAGRRLMAGLGNSTRGIYGGGENPSVTNVIEFVTIASTGNATNFGDLTDQRRRMGDMGLSNQTRGLFCGGYDGSSGGTLNLIDFITIASTGNAVDYGDLENKRETGASFASPTRGLNMGGRVQPANTKMNNIEFVTIASTGNAQDFGDLVTGRIAAAGASNSIRGLIMGGSTMPADITDISFMTIATKGNSVHFGDLTNVTDYPLGAMASPTRACVGGGNYPSMNDDIEYVNIATEGNSVFFGNLLAARGDAAGCSNGHGGL